MLWHMPLYHSPRQGALCPKYRAYIGGSRGFPLARYTYGSATSNIGLLVVADLQSVKRPPAKAKRKELILWALPSAPTMALWHTAVTTSESHEQ